jgi:hypothetical protein
MTAWLRAQVEADKAAAEAAPGEHWSVFTEVDIAGASVYDEQWVLLYPKRYDHDKPLSAEPGATGPQYIEHRRNELAAHIAIHDPRDVIADCDAKLAALDLCERVIRDDAEDHDDCGAASSWTGFAVARLTVQLLASGYRHRDGWQEEWAA